MYAQQVDTGVAKVQTLDEMSDADRAFQARVDADIKIEPTDAMPEAYRRTLVRQIAQRVTVLHLGRIFARGTLESILQDEKVAEIYLGKTHAH